MSQHDYIIDNALAPTFRSDLNAALAAIVSQNSGGTAPPTTYANMLWYDTATDLLKIRNEANSGWITMGTINQSTSNFESATVNGKTIGTLTAAGGIAYATSTTALAATGAGTAGQVLKSGGSGAPTWGSAFTTLLGTITTSFTPSLTLSSLDLTPYKFLHISFKSIGCSVNSNNLVLASTGTVVPIGLGFTTLSHVMSGIAIVDLSGGSVMASINTQTASGISTSSQSAFAGVSGITNSSTQVYFGWSASGAFDTGGTIKVYGVQ
jgi:hypothetical protein